jgi:hypothetical protein
MDRVHFTSGRALPLLAHFGIEFAAELVAIATRPRNGASASVEPRVRLGPA